MPLPGVSTPPQDGQTPAPNRGASAAFAGSPAKNEPGPQGLDAGGEVSFSVDPSAAGEERAEVLTPGEKQILGLMFDDQEGGGLTLYGRRPVKPVVMGHFLDVRG